MVLRRSIEKLLVASENSFVDSDFGGNVGGSSRGEKLEQDVCEWLSQNGLKIALKRFRTPFAEVDIVAMDPSRDVFLFEVKSGLWPDDGGLNLSWSQRRRLRRASEWVREELDGLPGLPSHFAVDLKLVIPYEQSPGEVATRRDSFRIYPIF